MGFLPNGQPLAQGFEGYDEDRAPWFIKKEAPNSPTVFAPQDAYR